MFLIEKDLYYKAQPIFEKMLDYETSVKWAFKDNNAPCNLYVDDLINPKSCFLVMDWGFCYFGGKYNERFIDFWFDYIFTKRNFILIFSNAELLEIIEKTAQGNYENRRKTRFYYKLNAEKFSRNKFYFKELPENYDLILNTEKENERVILIYNGKEVGHCNAGYNKKTKEINFDIYLEEEHRNKGIGPVMCVKLIEYHLSQNCVYITWGCDGDNVPSVKCAEKLGFDMIHEGEMLFCIKK